MGYPNSIFSPAVRSNGQTIDAAHVNDLQTEVSALESGLLGTISHQVTIAGNVIHTAGFQSSNSTITNLTVTGGSTLAGLQVANSTLSTAVVGSLNATASTIATLNVSGGSTFAVRPVLPPPDAVHACLQSTFAVGSSAASTLSYLAEFANFNSSMHSTGTNPERFTPQSTGFYALTCQIALEGPPNAASHIRLTVADSSNARVGYTDAQDFSTFAAIQTRAYKRFDVLGSYLKVVFENLSGGSTHSLSSGVNGWAVMEKL